MPSRPLTHAVRRIRDKASRKAVDRLPDGELVSAFVSTRAEPAFAELLRRHGPMVLGVCRRLTGHREDAEDAFQATFLILARRADTVRPRELVGAWLHGVARRCSRDSRRADERRRARERRDAPTETEPADAVAQRNELVALIDAEVTRLPEALRLPVILCELEGRSRAEVAKSLGLPMGTLSSRLATARKRLAARLGNRGLALAGLLTATVSDSLAQTTLAMAAGGTVSPAIAEILKGASLMNRFATWNMIAAVMVSAGLIGGLTVSMAGPPKAVPPVKPEPATGEPAELVAATNNQDDPFSIANLPPVVVKTEPVSGTEGVDPNTKELKATFSKDMIVENFSWVQVSREHFPETTDKPRFLDDKRTCVLPVKLQPGKTYVLWLNQGRFSSFMDADGNRAVPYMLVFRTADADK